MIKVGCSKDAKSPLYDGGYCQRAPRMLLFLGGTIIVLLCDRSNLTGIPLLSFCTLTSIMPEISILGLCLIGWFFFPAQQAKATPCMDAMDKNPRSVSHTAEPRVTGKQQAKTFAPSSRSNPAVARWNQEIDRAAKDADMNLAQSTIRRMQAAGASPDIVSYNSVIHACTKAGSMERASYWVEELCSKGLNANVITYNTLIDAYGKSEDAAGAEACLRRMREAGVEPNVVSYATVMNARAKMGDTERAE